MIDKPQRILITGASGAVGPRIVRTFHEAGFFVKTFSLDPPELGLYPAGVETIVGDITDLYAVTSAMDGIDCVIHMAALLHIDDPPPSLQPMYERINVDGTANVVEACIREKVWRIVFFSTIAVYGPGKGRIITEETPTNPDSLYARTKLEAEKIVLAAKGLDGHALGTVLRLSTVYGVRVKGNYRRLVQSLSRRRFVPIGNGKNRRTLVYDRDVATGTILAAMHPIGAGRIYNVTDGRFYAMKEIIAVLSELLGQRPPRVALPVELARHAAGTLDFLAKRLGKKSPVTRATIDKYIEDMAVSGQRIILELGFSPRFDLAQGWSEVIREMQRDGDL